MIKFWLFCLFILFSLRSFSQIQGEWLFVDNENDKKEYYFFSQIGNVINLTDYDKYDFKENYGYLTIIGKRSEWRKKQFTDGIVRIVNTAEKDEETFAKVRDNLYICINCKKYIWNEIKKVKPIKNILLYED